MIENQSINKLVIQILIINLFGCMPTNQINGTNAAFHDPKDTTHVQIIATQEATRTVETITPNSTSTNIPGSTQPTNSRKGIQVVSIKMINNKDGWGYAMNNSDKSQFLPMLLNTSDGGINWHDATPDLGLSSDYCSHDYACNEYFAYNNIKMYEYDNTHAWVIKTSPGGFLDIWRTTDGAKHWKKTNIIVLDKFDSWINDMSILAIKFSDPVNGWMELNIIDRAMGQGYTTVYTTNNGGINWYEINNKIFEMPFCDGHFYIDSKNQGWTINKSICMIGGINSKDTGYNGYVRAFNLYHSDSISHFIEYPAIDFQRSYDGGITWKSKPISAPSGMVKELILKKLQDDISYNVVGLDNYGNQSMGFYLMFAIKDTPYKNYFYITFDYGDHWNIQSVNEDVFRAIKGVDDYWASYVMRFYFVDSNNGWKRTYLSNGKTKIEQTSDGGETWKMMADDLDWHGDPIYINKDTGWVLTKEGDLLKTIDGGMTWNEININIY
jgi:photosystem II stability/assembly factor-like uncharacterized protein